MVNNIEKKSEVFDLGRVWRYFRYDVVSCISGQGLSLLVVSVMPLFLLFVTGIVSVIFTPSHSWTFPQESLRVIALVFSVIFVVIQFPTRMYGALTEKKYGSQWILLPASRLEKFLSMMIVSLVLVPFAFMLVYGLSDYLAALLDPAGEPMLFGAKAFGEDASLLSAGAGGLWIGWNYIASSIIVFLLGAVVFKKRKVALTFLCFIAFFMVVSTIFALVAKSWDWEQIIKNLDIKYAELTYSQLVNKINAIIWACTIIWFALFGGLTAWRLNKLEL